MAARGGKREGAGRKTRKEELGLAMLIEEALNEGQMKRIFKKLADKAEAGSTRHAEILLGYAFGKPQQRLDVTSNDEAIPLSVTIIEKKRDE